MPPPEALSRQSLSALSAHALLLGGAGAAIFLAGGAEQGNLGVYLLCAGVALVACPPKVRVEWPLWAAAGGLVGCAALAFLPARFVPVPLWRRTLAEVPAITLPDSITAAPGATAFWLGILALSVVIGLFALTQPVRARWMMTLALAAVLTCAVYAGLAMAAKVSGWNYPFSGGSTFGFLPNRNHTATLLLTGGVLAAALMGVAFRDRRWLVADAAVAGAVTCMAALFFFSSSRAGVLILLAGVALWVAGLGRRHRPGRLVAVAAVAAAAAMGVFLAIPSLARDRVLETMGVQVGEKATPTPTPTPTPVVAAAGVTAAGIAPQDLPSEFRARVYHDVLVMIRDQPWTGTGLGTFAGVFAQYRRESLVDLNALHPESDWLMLMAEAGLPAFGFAALLVGLAAGRLAGQREHPYWPLRWGFAAAAAAALLHSAVDVPAHRAALGWWMLALAGLALQRQKAEGRRQEAEAGEEPRGRWPGRVQHAVFVLAGVGALALGGTLVRAEWFGGQAFAPFAADTAPRRMFDAYQRKDYAGGMALGRQTLREAPLTASAYYYMGVLLTAVSDEEDADQQVDELFRAERVLDPVMPDVPRHQAAAWAGYDPVRQTAMTMEEFGRQSRIDRVEERGLKEDLRWYRGLVLQNAAQPDAQRYLLAMTRPDERFENIWAHAAEPALAQTRVDRIAEDQAWVAARGSGALRPDWNFALESAEPAAPAETGAAGAPEWEAGAWPVRVRQCVYAGKYEQAVKMLTERYGISLDGPADDGAAEAGRAARAGKWKEAWLALERYVRRTRQMEWP